MKRNAIILMTIGCLFFITGSAAGQSGLWLGEATIGAVSEPQAPRADLGFDLAMTGIITEDTLIPKGDTWKYYDKGSYPSFLTGNPSWISASFDDSSWSSGAAPLGYGGSQKTLVSYGSAASKKYVTTVFRKSFTVNNVSDYKEIRIKVWRNDGVVLYLNGKELFRDNIPTGYVAYSTYATSISDTTYEKTFNPNPLTSGNNVLVAEVHIQSPSDATMLFDCSVTGVRTTPVNTSLIGAGAAQWRYLHTSAGVSDSTWKNTNFDDSAWQTGQAKFGYGDDNQQTLLVSDTGKALPAAYFRKTFSITSVLNSLRFELLCDDGAIVYINGSEVMRYNMNTAGTSPVEVIRAADENRITVKEVTVANLQTPLNTTGNNVVAVAVYQHPSEQGQNTAETTPTPSPFKLRVLLHADAAGTVRLLKEAILMYEKIGGKPVVVANYQRISEFTTGSSAGKRYSAVNFDFSGATVTCSGSIGKTGTLTCNVDLPSDHPTNPFLHRYHPDHDNLDARYEKTTQESYAISRKISIQFASRFPPDTSVSEWKTAPPGWGTSLMGGTYTEIFSGLHKKDIKVRGPVILQRVSDVGELRQ